MMNANLNKEVNWIDVCRKCGKQIYNGFVNPETIDQVRIEMTKIGYEIGHKTKMVGTFGNLREAPIKPICSTCSNENTRKENDRKQRKQLKKVLPMIKKVFCCPFLKYDCHETFSTKEEVINHLKNHRLSDLVGDGD